MTINNNIKTRLKSSITKVRDNYNDFQRQRKINPEVRTMSYKVSPSSSSSIASGAVILSIGLTISMVIPALNFNNRFIFSDITIIPLNVYNGLKVLIIQLTLGILVNYQDIIPNLIIGWFIGGIIASIIYETSGRRGPYYSSLLIVIVISVISISYSIILLTLNNGHSLYNNLFNPIRKALILNLLIALLSIPLIIVSIIGYRIGGVINHE